MPVMLKEEAMNSCTDIAWIRHRLQRGENRNLERRLRELPRGERGEPGVLKRRFHRDLGHDVRKWQG